MLRIKIKQNKGTEEDRGRGAIFNWVVREGSLMRYYLSRDLNKVREWATSISKSKGIAEGGHLGVCAYPLALSTSHPPLLLIPNHQVDCSETLKLPPCGTPGPQCSDQIPLMLVPVCVFILYSPCC